MKRLLLVIFFFVYSTGCQSKGGDSSLRQYQGVGVVKAIPESNMHVNIDHEAIEGFMDAMQMFFPVADSNVLSGIQVSDSIRFMVVVENGNYVISSIDRMN